MSLAFALGIRTRTLWWLIMKNREQLIANGDGVYRRFRIPKKKGGYREIHEPRPALKNVQKSLLATVFNPLPVGPQVAAYVPGKSIQDSAQVHVARPVKISMDIKDFFGSTRRAWVRDMLRGVGFNEEVVRPLSSLITVPTTNHRGDTVSVVPQGAPTSGAVANHVAISKIDRPVMSFLSSQITDGGFHYTRYSDNLEISFDEDLDRDTVDFLRDGMIDLIQQGGYRVAPDKTYIQRVNSPTRPYRVLGFAANEKLNIPNEKFHRLRNIVHNVATDGGYDNQYRRFGASSPEQMETRLRAQLTYWKQVAPWKIQPLIEKLDQMS